MIKKLNPLLLMAMLLFISSTVFSAGFPPPDKVQEAFQKMYPKVTTVDWERKGDYHIADIRVKGRSLNVWFSDKGKWLMTETDVESLEAVPPVVAKAFMQSTMASMQLEDVRIITFPKQPAVIIIEVEEYDTDSEFQLFYSPDGKLLQTFNVSETGGEIYPGLFK